MMVTGCDVTLGGWEGERVLVCHTTSNCAIFKSVIQWCRLWFKFSSLSDRRVGLTTRHNGTHRRGLLRLAKVHATASAARTVDAHVVTDVLVGLRGVLQEVLVRVRHLDGVRG